MTRTKTLPLTLSLFPTQREQTPFAIAITKAPEDILKFLLNVKKDALIEVTAVST